MAVNVGKFANEGLSGFDQFFTSTIKSVGNLAVGELAKFASAGMGDLVAKAGMGSITASVVSSVASTAVSTYGGAAVNALEFSDGGFGFNKDAFKQATAGAGMAMLKSGVTSLVQSSIMVSKGATWQNGRMGWTDKTAKQLAFGTKLQQHTRSLAGTISGLVSEGFNAAQGNGFSLNLLNSAAILGSDNKLNHQGLLSFTIGGDNSGFSFGSAGFAVNQLSGFADSLDYFANDYKDDKQAQFIVNNSFRDEGQARLTYANWGILSRNKDAMKTSMQIINGEKKLVFGEKASGEKHFGHAGVEENTVYLSREAINISKDDLAHVGSYTGVMTRESALIDMNKRLQALGQDIDLDAALGQENAHNITLDAVKIQDQVLNSISDNMGVEFTGKWGKLRDVIGNAAATGDLSGMDVTGRDWKKVGDALLMEKGDTWDYNCLKAIGYNNYKRIQKQFMKVFGLKHGDGVDQKIRNLLKDLENVGMRPEYLFFNLNGGLADISGSSKFILDFLNEKNQPQNDGSVLNNGKYVYQADVKPNGRVLCQSASGSMFLSAMGVEVSTGEFYRYAVEKYSSISGMHNPAQLPKYGMATAQYFLDRAYGKGSVVLKEYNYAGKEKLGLNRIKERASKGYPVVFHAYKKISHVMAAIGHNSKGVIVNDPAGSYNEEKYPWNSEGQKTIYSNKLMLEIAGTSHFYSVAEDNRLFAPNRFMMSFL